MIDFHDYVCLGATGGKECKVIMKISLVMAVYNGEKYILEQLQSIFFQTKKIDEVIIIDDCSKDKSLEIINEFIRDKNLYYWKILKNDKNLGYRDNFRKGLKLSTGDIVFLCDQDDRWHKNKVEIMIKEMSEKVLSLSSSFRFMNQVGEIFEIKLEKSKANHNLLDKKISKRLTEISLEGLLKSNFSQGCTMAVKRSIINEYLNKSTKLFPHDWELNIISAINGGCYYLDEELIDYRIHDNNTIGLDKTMNRNIVKYKKNRVQQRIQLTQNEIDIIETALKYKMSMENRKLCNDKMDYLKKRKYFLEKKKFLKVIQFYLKGKYKRFGTLKTCIGDLMCILKCG